MEFSQILYAKENRVATMTLNRPEKLNAYSEMMVHETLAALADARDDDEIRAVNLAATTDFRHMLDREAETHLRCGMTEDHKEGARAFMERRQPNFTGH